MYVVIFFCRSDEVKGIEGGCITTQVTIKLKSRALVYILKPLKNKGKVREEFCNESNFSIETPQVVQPGVFSA